MSLSDTAIRNTKPASKPFKLSDERGLYMIVRPTGGKWWRFDYSLDGKRKTLSLGVYPDVSLKAARIKRDELRTSLAAGIDPGAVRKAEKLATADTFEAIAREWHATHSAKWSTGHASDILARMEKNLFPWLGDRPLIELKAPEILAVLRRIEARGAPIPAQRALQYVGQIFRFAIATGRAERDTSADLRGALTTVKAKNRASIIDGTNDNKAREQRVGELLRTLHGYEGTFTVVCALRLAPLVFVRPGELRQAQWCDIDLEAAQWRYHITKTDVQHIVPLSRQALAILHEIQPLTGQGRYVFPSARSNDRPMSDNALLAAMRRMGIDKEAMTGHGWRAVFRTLGDEVLGFRVEHMEHQLAHAVKDANGTAYNRTAHISERKKMMQVWADYLDGLRAGSNVIHASFTKAA
jgi:integrase